MILSRFSCLIDLKELFQDLLLKFYFLTSFDNKNYRICLRSFFIRSSELASLLSCMNDLSTEKAGIFMRKSQLITLLSQRALL